MASRGVDPATLAAMDWRDVGATLQVIDRATKKANEKPSGTLDEDQAAAFRAQMAALSKGSADG